MLLNQIWGHNFCIEVVHKIFCFPLNNCQKWSKKYKKWSNQRQCAQPFVTDGNLVITKLMQIIGLIGGALSGKTLFIEGAWLCFDYPLWILELHLSRKGTASLKNVKSLGYTFTWTVSVTLSEIWDPQIGSTFCKLATNPGWLVVASLKNLTHKKLKWGKVK